MQKTSREKAGLFVDSLLATHDPLAFPTLLRSLIGRYPDVVDELRLEMQYEQGNIPVVPDTASEVGNVTIFPFWVCRV